MVHYNTQAKYISFIWVIRLIGNNKMRDRLVEQLISKTAPFFGSNLYRTFVISMLRSYLKYRRKRVNAHGIHSPFVFDFYNAVIKRVGRNQNKEVELFRRKLLTDKTAIEITDFGAGSRKNKTNIRTVTEMVKNASIPPKYGALLAQIIAHYDLKNVLELGTSLGISTAYLASTKKELAVVSLEGCPNTAKLAQKNMEALGIENVLIMTGEFTSSLNQLQEERRMFDLIYIDGNHQLEPTLAYFNFALNHIHDDGFIIFDDIHWSSGMEMAWEKIKTSEQVNVTMDLYKLGIVCKRKKQRKEHFILKF